MEASQGSNLGETVADNSDNENMDIPETEKKAKQNQVIKMTRSHSLRL